MAGYYAGQTLLLASRVHWIVAEDSPTCSPLGNHTHTQRLSSKARKDFALNATRENARSDITVNKRPVLNKPKKEALKGNIFNAFRL